jgi:hypothetical protein
MIAGLPCTTAASVSVFDPDSASSENFVGATDPMWRVAEAIEFVLSLALGLYRVAVTMANISSASSDTPALMSGPRWRNVSN